MKKLKQAGLKVNPVFNRPYYGFGQPPTFVGKKITMPSETTPDGSFTLRQLLDRYSRGIQPDTAIPYGDAEDFSLNEMDDELKLMVRDMNSLDLVDKKLVLQNVSSRIEEHRKRLNHLQKEADDEKRKSDLAKQKAFADELRKEFGSNTGTPKDDAIPGERNS